MRRLASFFLVLTLLFSLASCQGNFGAVNLQEPISLSEDAVVKESVIAHIQQENAVAVFTGQSGEFEYEWTVFGSDIEQAKEINLGVSVVKTAEGDAGITLVQNEPFGFSALLSVYLDESWNAQSATAYEGEKGIASVSLTGSKNTILNIVLDGSVKTLTISPDPLPKDHYTPPEDEPSAGTDSSEEISEPEENDESSASKGAGYLSGVEDQENKVYSGDKTGSEDAVVIIPDSNSGGGSGYLSGVTEGDDKVYSDGKDKYHTDPVPEGMPAPVEPEDQEINKGTAYTCTFSIECSTILNNLDLLEPDKLEMVPASGVILEKTTITFYEGESVFDVLKRLCKEKEIHMEAAWTPIYNSAYVEGIHNLYEFDCGAMSGWMYRVNGWYPNYGSSRYELKDGDLVEWRYTCDYGDDIGGGYAIG